MKKLSMLIWVFIVLPGIYSKAQLLNQEDLNPNITPYDQVHDMQSGKFGTLYQLQKPWQDFKANHPNWGARFNYYSKMPHRAIGSPIQGNGQTVRQIAENFLRTDLNRFNIPMDELILTREYNDGKFKHIDFKQIHNGMEVLWSRVMLRLTQDNKIILFGVDAYNDIPQNFEYQLTSLQAKNVAIQSVNTPVNRADVSPEMKILPVPNGSSYFYHPVYEVIVHTQNDKYTPGEYLTYISALSGEVLYRANRINHIGFTIDAALYNTNQNSPAQNLPLKNLKVVEGTTNYYTDQNGFVTIPGTSVNINVPLEGKYVRVRHTQSGTTIPSYSTTVSTNNSTVTLPTGSVTPQIQHYTCYYHANEIHDFMKTKLPSFTAMDNPLTANVDRTDGNCNAFYNGTSINFYTPGGGCVAFSTISDVMYHEYGHGISREFYNWQGSNFSNGAMGEGYSDCWAFFLNNNPLIGQGYTSGNPNSTIRRYDINPKVYPDDIIGEVHADGEIIAGAWWDTYQYWGDQTAVSSLFAESLFGLANGPNGSEGQVYFDILIDALEYDDTDNDITNGTPHFNHIVQGFADHGIYLLNNAELVHQNLGVQQDNTPIPVTGQIFVDFEAFLGNVDMEYRLKNSTNIQNTTLVRNGTLVSGTFPSQTSGEVYEYFFKVKDNANTYEIIQPKECSFTQSYTKINLPYSLLIGYHPVWQELFTNGTAPAGWTVGNVPGDNATKGIWEVGTPIPSYQSYPDSSTIVQTGWDVSGENNCAFTANALNASTSVGNADVDNGVTTLKTASINISGYTNPVLSYYRWFSNEMGSNPRKDRIQVQVSYNNGLSWNWVERTEVPDRSWRQSTYLLDKTKGTDIIIQFIASDVPGSSGGSLVEMAIDAVEIYDLGNIPLIAQNIENKNFEIFPNPAKNTLFIQSPSNGKLNYQFRDILGKTVISGTYEVRNGELTPVELHHVPPGIYVLSATQNGISYTNKIIVDR